MITADNNDNPSNVSSQNVPIPGLSDIHLLSHRIYVIIIVPILHMWKLNLGFSHLLIMYFRITNYPNLGDLTQ